MSTQENVTTNRAGNHSIQPLEVVRDNEKLWTPQYGVYDHNAMLQKLASLQLHLATRNGSERAAIDDDLAATEAFINRCFKDFNDPLADRDEGSFGFVVPPRIRRQVGGEQDDYMAEWDNLCPVLRHFDSDTAQRFLAGLPPFIVDQYGQDKDGRTGYMLCAPMFADMRGDLSGEAFFSTGIKVMNDTLAMAKRLNIKTVGLGATLPHFLFMTDRSAEKRGYSVDDQGIELTTGHAGTVYLIGETVRRLTQDGFKGFNGSIGVLGAGSIGMATIQHLRENLGYSGTISVYDSSEKKAAAATALDPEHIVRVSDEKELLLLNDTVICAATTTLGLRSDLGLVGNDALKDLVLIDDSQPGCFDAKEVASCGGKLVWVIGQDSTERGELTRSGFNYSGFGPIGNNENWGCEQEAYFAWLARVTGQIGSLAIRREITFADVDRYARFASQHGAKIARLQAAGTYVTAA